MKSTISSKGQVTVPAQLREKLGLKAGTPVRFELRQGAIILRRGKPAIHPVDALFGKLDLGKPVDEILDDMRGPRPVSRVNGRVRRPTARR